VLNKDFLCFDAKNFSLIWRSTPCKVWPCEVSSLLLSLFLGAWQREAGRGVRPGAAPAHACTHGRPSAAASVVGTSERETVSIGKLAMEFNLGLLVGFTFVRRPVNVRSTVPACIPIPTGRLQSQASQSRIISFLNHILKRVIHKNKME